MPSSKKKNKKKAPSPPVEQGIQGQRKDPFKYVLSRTDFRRLVRWPNDGIEQENKRQDHKHYNVTRSNADQRALTELFGGCWIYEKSLSEMDPEGKQMVISMPFLMQYKAAKDMMDPEAAKKHLIQQYKNGNRDLRELLASIDCKSVLHKCARDARRFPGIEAILYPLFQRQLASEENIELLFGNVSWVLYQVLDIGTEFANPPPFNTPAGARRAQFLRPGKVKAAPKECANCGKQERELNRCTACKTVHYCSPACQKTDWVLHRPDCFAIQGKEVTDSVLEKAKDEYQRRQAAEEAEKALVDAVKQKEREEAWKAMIDEPPVMVNFFSHTCVGERRKVSIPAFAPFVEAKVAAKLELEYEEELHLAVLPEGFDDKYSGRGGLIKNPSTNAKIIVLHDLLFANNGDGRFNGYFLEGIFVVHEVDRSRNSAIWRLVPEPSYYPDQNRLARFQLYLRNAKGLAMAVSEDVELGIYNADETFSNMKVTSTPFGDHYSL